MQGNKKLKSHYDKYANVYDRKTYKGVKHIKYLQDFLNANPNLNFKKLDLQTFDSKAVAINEFGNLYEKLYKKVTRQGYKQKLGETSKKQRKKNQGDQNNYDPDDPFIDDGEMGLQRENEEPIYSDFKSISGSLEDFYKSSYFNFTQNKRVIDRSDEQNTKAIRKIVKPNEQVIESKDNKS